MISDSSGSLSKKIKIVLNLDATGDLHPYLISVSAPKLLISVNEAPLEKTLSLLSLKPIKAQTSDKNPNWVPAAATAFSSLCLAL